MAWPATKRSLFLYVTLGACALAVCGWQAEEHARFRRAAAQGFINRVRDITSTLGVVVKSQRRFGVYLARDRLQLALQELVHPEGLESITILSATGEPIASAGQPVEPTAEMLRSPGVYWQDKTLTIMNLVDFGSSPNGSEEDRPPTIVLPDDQMFRNFRPPGNRRPPGAEKTGPPDRPAGSGAAGTGDRFVAGALSATVGAGSGTAAPAPVTATPTPSPASPTDKPPETASAEKTGTAPAEKTGTGSPAPSTGNPVALPPASVAASGAPASAGNTVAASASPAPTPRRLFGKPPGMSTEEYETVIQKQGVHSLVLSFSAEEMNRSVERDLWLRSLVSLLAVGGALVSGLAWRNLTKNSELQIRLVKAGEMNTHLKEMNLAAAGLAHETRNPLNIIRGLAQMVSLQAKSAPKLQEYASTIIEEADRVTVQLNEFINYSKPREAHLAPVVVSRLTADVTRTLVPDIEEKSVRLIPLESQLAIEADEPLLRQALFNLLLNAVQAVGQGGRIEIRLVQTGPRQAELIVADDGPGVPAADRTTIFKPYVTMKPKGVGLGLAIVQQIVSAHGWEIRCEENTPHGALFRIRHLKIAAASA